MKSANRWKKYAFVDICFSFRNEKSKLKTYFKDNISFLQPYIYTVLPRSISSRFIANLAYRLKSTNVITRKVNTGDYSNQNNWSPVPILNYEINQFWHSIIKDELLLSRVYNDFDVPSYIWRFKNLSILTKICKLYRTFPMWI
jgi:hypothetical protein